MPPHRSQRHRASSPPAPSASSASSSSPLPFSALNKAFTGHAQRLLDEFEKEVQGMGHAEVSMLRGDVYSLLRLIEQRDGCHCLHLFIVMLFRSTCSSGGGCGTREQHDDEQDERNRMLMNRWRQRHPSRCSIRRKSE